MLGLGPEANHRVMGMTNALAPRGVRRGMGLVIVLVWAGWAVAVLVAPILRQAEGNLLDAAPVSLLGGPPAAGGPLVSVPVRLPRRGRAAGPTKLAKMVRDLADMYSKHCECAGATCPCAQEAATAVGAALDNAVDREFAPPNMYYRSKDGYAFRLRGFQEAKTHMNGGLKHGKFLDLEPITARWRQPRAPEPAPVAAPNGERTGLAPIKVPARFVSAPGAETYASAHFVRKVTDDDVVAPSQKASEAPPYGTSAVGVVGRWLHGGYPHTQKSKKVRTAARGHGTWHGVRFPSASGRTAAEASVSAPAQLGQQQTTQLWEFNYVPLADEEFPGKHPTVFEQQALKEAYLEHLAEECKQDAERCMAACKEDPAACKDFSEAKEEDEKDDLVDPGNLEDDLDDLDAMMKKLGVPDYTKMILSDGELEAAKAQSGIPPENDAALAIPYQEGEEADFADWLYAHDDDAVRPLRLVEGQSNFPEMDANINAPGAVLEDYPGQKGGGESFASFLKHPAGEGGEMRADASSINGWLTDNGAY